MNDAIIHVLKRFAHRRKMLVQRMTVDSEFYALCQDYETCVKALHHWKTSRAPEAPDRRSEYNTIVQELEAEITQILCSSDPQPLWSNSGSWL